MDSAEAAGRATLDVPCKPPPAAQEGCPSWSPVNAQLLNTLSTGSWGRGDAPLPPVRRPGRRLSSTPSLTPQPVSPLKGPTCRCRVSWLNPIYTAPEDIDEYGAPPGGAHRG